MVATVVYTTVVSHYSGVVTVDGSLLSNDAQTQNEALLVNLYSFSGGAGNVSPNHSNCVNSSCHGHAGRHASSELLN